MSSVCVSIQKEIKPILKSELLNSLNFISQRQTDRQTEVRTHREREIQTEMRTERERDR